LKSARSSIAPLDRDHQGVVAIGAARAAATFESILASANKEHGKPD